jgi:hypothetical protein
MWPDPGGAGLRYTSITARNDSSMPVTNVQAVVEYYDANGQLIETSNSFGDLLWVVGPGEVVGIFDLPPSSAASYSVKVVAGYETEQPPNRVFRINSVSWSPPYGAGTYHFLNVSVTNLNRAIATDVIFQAICHNAEGVYVFGGWGSTLRDLGPGETMTISEYESLEDDPPCEGTPVVTIDATSAPTEPIAVPSSPSSVVASAGEHAATVAWSGADGNGGTITSYTVTASPGGQTMTVNGGQSSALFSGLTGGVPYTFTVRATNVAGTGAPSAPSNAVVPLATPPDTANAVVPLATPPDTAITGGPANGAFALSASARFSYSSTAPGSTFLCKLDSAGRSCGTSSVTFTELSQTTHSFTVAARDSQGDIDPSPTARTWTVPRSNTKLAHSSGWAKRTGSGYYLGTYSQTRSRGATLTANVSGARRLALVATRGEGFGTVKVYLGSTLLKKISLAASTTRKRQLISIASFSRARTGKVRIVVTSSSKTLRIEGLGVATR